MKKLIATLATATLTAGLLFAGAPAADANVHKRVRVAANSYGHVVAYDFYWRNWSLHERHTNVWPGQQSPRSWSVDYVRAVGRHCPGVLWWTAPSPDKNLGWDALVGRAHTTFRVTDGC